MSHSFAKAAKLRDHSLLHSSPRPPRNLFTSRVTLSTSSSSSSISSATSYSDEETVSPAEATLIKDINKHHAKYASGRTSLPSLNLQNPSGSDLSEDVMYGSKASTPMSSSMSSVARYLNDCGDSLVGRLLLAQQFPISRGGKPLNIKNPTLHTVQTKGQNLCARNGDLEGESRGNEVNTQNNGSQRREGSGGGGNSSKGNGSTGNPEKGNGGKRNAGRRDFNPLETGSSKGKKSRSLECPFRGTIKHKPHFCDRLFLSANHLHPHLEHKHDFFNDGNALAEPEGRDPNDSDSRHGLCKVCYQGFDSFDDLKAHVDGYGRDARPDQSRSAELKHEFMSALFVSTKSVAEIRAEYADRGIPFKKPEKSKKKAIGNQVSSKSPSVTAARESASSTFGDVPMQTPSSSATGNRSKRPSSSQGASSPPERSRKQHRSRTSLVPSLGSAISITESFPSSNDAAQPGLDDALSRSHKFAKVPPQTYSIDPAILGDSAHINPSSPVFASASAPVPPRDNKLAADFNGGATVSVVLDSGEEFFFPHPDTPAKIYITGPLKAPLATILSDGSIVTWMGQKATPKPNGYFENSYDKAYDTRPEVSITGAQNDEANEQSFIEMDDL